ncbi:BTB/POZ domain-containing protein NPY4-like [Phalaenopsis equestris]|uniref:BTB/POZ domain-containing protein NPY4-like n=1 Tax=Phalaenopsis equestris TaxID=78828 RepID=UPI0009E556CD|nr:BTB/POZ domain-containing protein NPY4-like [Phalaenopsis equestris]
MKYMKLGSKPDAFQSDGKNIRFAATELETDIIINVGDVKFYLHRFQLLSKSLRLQRLTATNDAENSDEIDIHDIPGGSASFEICAKFCYGMIVTLNAYNVAAARCAAEHLEMHETAEKGNLIYKIDVFLNSSIFCCWKDSIIMLQTTKILQPWADELKIVNSCIDSIASKASMDPAKVEWSYAYNRNKLPSENGLDLHWNGVVKQQSVPKDWWVEDLCELEMELYERVIMTIKSRGGVEGRVVGESLKAYACRKLPGFIESATHGGDFAKCRTLLEAIVWLLPPERGSVSCSFMLRLLKAASFIDCGENWKKELIKRLGCQLHEASVTDLLIPIPVGESTLYDTEIVLRMVEEFLLQEHGGSRASLRTSKELQESPGLSSEPGSPRVAVANLVDGYLAEVAKDPNLTLSTFIELAEMVSGASRLSNDQLYHAIDSFLKEHPDLTKIEKKKICSLLDCSKLSHDSCIHAVQNNRLPLRTVVQILYYEQSKQFALCSCGTNLSSGRASSLVHQENRSASYGSSRSAATTNTDNELNIISLKSTKLNGIGENGDNKSNEKVKGALVPKRTMCKLWLGKMQVGESSSSGTPNSIGSMNRDEARSTPSRNSRHSVS